eukprot:5144397-Pleurochrysis_carterae.AAC.1
MLRRIERVGLVGAEINPRSQLLAILPWRRYVTIGNFAISVGVALRVRPNAAGIARRRLRRHGRRRCRRRSSAATATSATRILPRRVDRPKRGPIQFVCEIHSHELHAQRCRTLRDRRGIRVYYRSVVANLKMHANSLRANIAKPAANTERSIRTPKTKYWI